MKYAKWSDEEVKTSFKFIEIKKSEGYPLIKIFDMYAKSVCRCKNSVRNYYYKEIESLKNDNERAKMLNINLYNHVIVKGNPFSKEEEDMLLKNMEKLINNGYSVRKACLTLSNNDIAKMIRLQNKYRALKRGDEKNNMGEIIKMPEKRDGLNDEDIKALFLGLINLVKKQEFNNAKKNMENELNLANEKLKKALEEIVLKQKKIELLKNKIALLTNENKVEQNAEDKKIKSSASAIIKIL